MREDGNFFHGSVRQVIFAIGLLWSANTWDDVDVLACTFQSLFMFRGLQVT